MSVDAATALGQVITTQVLTTTKEPVVKEKTLWIDDNAEGKATGVPHKYTIDNVATICTDAITAGLKRNRSGKSVTTGSYSVKTPWGNNICVTVSNRSCFPARIQATTAVPGAQC